MKRTFKNKSIRNNKFNDLNRECYLYNVYNKLRNYLIICDKCRNIIYKRLSQIFN